MTFTHRSSLPIELWRLIIGHLAHEDKKSCLLVSSQLHDVALSELFSHVTLYFGLWMSGHDNWSEEEIRAEMERLNKITWEILRHVSCTPAFATIIKQLSVRAYTEGDGLFELFCLAEALQKLDGLQSLRWYGSSPLPNSIVLDALAKRACPALIDLRLPVLGAAVPSLTAFTGLHSLYLYDNSVFGEPKLENYIRDTIENNSKSLTRLSISGDIIWACPIRSLTNLHELEIIMPKELGGLALIFRHCVTLLSLTLHLDSVVDEHPLFPVLESNLTALPELTAFKLIDHSSGATYVQRQIIAKFLENRKNLRKLDVCVSRDWDEERRDPCLDILPTLPALNVLGLNLHECYSEDLLTLDQLLPINVTALMFQVEVWSHEDEDAYLRAWIDLLRKRRSIQYFHIIDYTGDADLKIQLLEDHPESLRLVGYGPYLRWIKHDPEEGTRYSSSWSFERVAHRTVETFGCADWEWLFRHHDDRIGELISGQD